jgi:uncharacterized protein (TIGR00725 family)
MGGGQVAPAQLAAAYRLGELIAGQGWVLLNGGRNVGIMDASARGAHEQGGLTIGILPENNRSQASPHLDIAIVTGMGSARNNINVLSSDLVVACSGDAGTISEIALALKAGRKTVLLGFDVGPIFDRYEREGQLFRAAGPEEAIDIARQLVDG